MYVVKFEPLYFIYLLTTAYSSTLCSALLTLNLVSGLIQLLPFAQGINTMVCMCVCALKPNFDIMASIEYFTFYSAHLHVRHILINVNVVRKCT